jgi:outer membrane protein assembly factor BamB
LLEEQRAHQQPVEIAPDAVTSKAGDYAEYRGVRRDGVVQGPALARDWQAHPPRELWRQPVGGGYAGFVVQGGVLVTIEQRRDREAVVCYDAATGGEVWVFSYPADFQESMGGPGPRATPTIAGTDVFSLGAVGDLVCLDLRTGKKKWNVNILADNANIMWAMSGSPLVYQNMVIVNAGAQTPASRGKALRAYDRSSGSLIWASGDTRAGYSSPMLATLAGKLQILLFDADCIAGYDPRDGARLWKKDWPGFQGVNVAQPLVVHGDRIFVSRSYDVGAGAMLKITEKDGGWQVPDPPLWENRYLRCKFTSPVLYKDHIFGLDEGIMVCLDVKTGKRLWRGGRYGHGQILLSGGLILVLAEDGKLVLVEAAGGTPGTGQHSRPVGQQELESPGAGPRHRLFAEQRGDGRLRIAGGRQIAPWRAAEKGNEPGRRHPPRLVWDAGRATAPSFADWRGRSSRCTRTAGPPRRTEPARRPRTDRCGSGT